MSSHPPTDDALRFAVVVTAAGVGLRMGGRKKPYVLMAGRPILHHALDRLQQTEGCAESIVVVHEDEYRGGRVAEELTELFAGTRVVCGGATRQQSAAAGLQAVSDELGLVLIHDAVRPLVSPQVVRQVALAAGERGAAIAAVPATETVKKVGTGDRILATPARRALWYARTPQGFQKELILRAHRRFAADGYNGTDDSELVEKLGHSVYVIQDSYDNIKITTAEDLVIAEAILKWQESRR
ncbi:MAG: 2-C-methyl-D-erythritol 4-phosphate cytidylyltransferase [Planctomycetes bacterium]|nr:2-C-methyl-D-erythritol 4-phosphate cytidylyltransferase [Planctomycetota bacterium]